MASLSSPLRVALVGNPNVGKTTLFNRLTGLHQSVANWPGTTVEYATGSLEHGGHRLLLTDLPGIYGLAAHVEDERVTRRFLLHDAPDAVVILVDATSPERSLFVALEMLELYPQSVIALNKVDLGQKHGIVVETSVLARRLGVPVVPVVAHNGQGLTHLLDAVVAVGSGGLPTTPAVVPYAPEFERAVEQVAAQLESEEALATPARWTALRLLQGDVEVLDHVRARPNGHRTLAAAASCCAPGTVSFETIPASSPAASRNLGDPGPRQVEYALEVADAKYALIRDVAAECVQEQRPARPSWTPRLDALALHPLWGPLLIAAVFGAMFWTSFEASAPASSAVAAAVEWLGNVVAVQLAAAHAPAWFSSLLVDGLIGGVGAVLSFVPYMAVFFACMALVESSRYMARAALVADSVMQALGLHGKSLFPLVSAFGCNVPALAATRGIESRRDRLATGLVIPFLPCNARLGVMAIMAAAFFPGGTAGLVILGLVAISFAVVAVTALLYRQTVLPSDPAPLLLELPSYTMPRWQDVLIPAFHHCYMFVRRIWRFLVPATILVWLLSTFPTGAQPADSYAGQLGSWLAPLGQPLGFDWRLMVAILFGFVAKETTLGTLGVLYGLTDGGTLAQSLTTTITPLVGFAFLLVYMLYVPCLATVVQMRRELGSWRWAGSGLVLNVGVAFGLGLLVERLGHALGVA